LTDRLARPRTSSSQSQSWRHHVLVAFASLIGERAPRETARPPQPGLETSPLCSAVSSRLFPPSCGLAPQRLRLRGLLPPGDRGRTEAENPRRPAFLRGEKGDLRESSHFISPRHREKRRRRRRRCALRASSAFKDGGIAGVCAAIDRDRNIRLEAPTKRNHWVCQGVVLAPGGGGSPQPLRNPPIRRDRPWPDQCARVFSCAATPRPQEQPPARVPGRVQQPNSQ
jgi:hypothetical protein